MSWTSSPADAATTNTVPVRATSDQVRHTARIRSPKKRAATTPTTIGCIAPMIVALTMLVSFTAEKKKAMSAPKAMPPHIGSRMICQRNGVPGNAHPDDDAAGEEPEAVRTDGQTAHLDALGEHGAGRPRHTTMAAPIRPRERSRAAAPAAGVVPSAPVDVVVTRAT